MASDSISDSDSNLHSQYFDRSQSRKDKFFKPKDRILKQIKFQNGSTLSLIDGNITLCRTEVIVNPANEGGLGCFQPGHNCLDNQIHQEAGPWLRMEELKHKQSRGYRNLYTAECMETDAYYLPSDRIIHVVGPRWNQHTPKQNLDKQLLATYQNMMNISKNREIVIPSISTGVFGFPVVRASLIALGFLSDYLSESKNVQQVYVCLYDQPTKETYLKTFAHLFEK